MAYSYLLGYVIPNAPGGIKFGNGVYISPVQIATLDQARLAGEVYAEHYGYEGLLVLGLSILSID